MKKPILIIFTILFISVPCFAQLQCLIKVPEAEKIKKKDYSLSEEVREKFKQKKTKSEVTQDLLCNTRVFKKYKLINFVTEMGLAELQLFIVNEKLKWTILAATEQVIEEGSLVTKDLLGYDALIVIDFIARKRIYDQDGNFIREDIPTEIEIWKFAGLPNMKNRQQITEVLE